MFQKVFATENKGSRIILLLHVSVFPLHLSTYRQKAKRNPKQLIRCNLQQERQSSNALLVLERKLLRLE